MSIKNQPDNLNLLQTIAFETNFQRIPNVNYFCQKVNIPGMVLGSAIQPTYFSDIPLEGDKLSFDTLDISFIIDEDMQNYQEIYSWLLSMGFPDNFPQFTALKTAPTSGITNGLRSDINVILHTNKSKPNYNITFKDAFPISLSAISFDASASNLDAIVADASFMFTSVFTIEKIT
jgi:hypothetical protein